MTGADAALASRPAGASSCACALTPKSSLEGVDGVEQTAEGAAFEGRVRAVPAEGEANAALEKLVARWLDVPQERGRA